MKFLARICIFLFCLSTACFCYDNSKAFNSCASADIAEIQLPILMYHSVLNKSKGQYIVSEQQLESDLIALEKHGFTTILPNELLDFVTKGTALPPKPVIITFDDGLYNNQFYAVNILQKYNAKAVFNVIGAFSDYASGSGDNSNPNYSHLTWEQIAQIDHSPLFEIGNHTYKMHDYKPRFGVSKRKCESQEQYVESLMKDFSKMEGLICHATGKKPVVFAYPFGKYTEPCDAVLDKLGYPIRLTCSEKINTIKVGDLDCLKKLGRYNRDGRYTEQNVEAILLGKKSCQSA